MSMTMVYQLGGNKKIWNIRCKFKVVNGSSELAEALASGWYLHPHDAAEAAAQDAADKAAKAERDEIDKAQKEDEEAQQAELQRLKDELSQDKAVDGINGQPAGAAESGSGLPNEGAAGDGENAEPDHDESEPGDDKGENPGTDQPTDESGSDKAEPENKPVRATRKASAAKK